MRGKNKCIILKGGFVEVELDAATRLESPWTSREVVGDLARRCGGKMLQTTWVIWEQCGGKRG